MRTLAVITLVAALLAACSSPVGDADVPRGMGERVESARRSLRSNEDGPFRSTFAFRAARCRADGGLLLVFEQASVAGRTSAFAMQGPAANAESWAGGLGVRDIDNEPEIVAFFADVPEVSCR